MTAQIPSEDAAAALHFEFTHIVREEVGFNEVFASQIAEAIVRGLRKRLGGQEIYVPAPSKSERIAAVRREFNGRNRDEICRKYGISRTTFYEYTGTSAAGTSGS